MTVEIQNLDDEFYRLFRTRTPNPEPRTPNPNSELTNADNHHRRTEQRTN
jgi:hypothetical protein